MESLESKLDGELTGIQVNVDIILPFHKIDDYLLEAIESVKASKRVQAKIIAVNDSGMDILPDQIGLNDSDQLVKSNSPGYLGALATGVQASKSEYIAFQDSDDFCDVHKLWKQANYLEINQLDLVTCQLIRTDKNGRVLSKNPIFGRIPKDYSPSRKLIFGPHGADSTIFGKASVIKDSWAIHSSFAPTFADYGWLLHVQNSKKLGHCEDAIYYYRSHMGQMSRGHKNLMEWNNINPLWIKNLKKELQYSSSLENVFSKLEEYPRVGLSIAFPAWLPRLNQIEKSVLSTFIKIILNRNPQNGNNMRNLLYRRAFLATRGREIRYWLYGLRMLLNLLYAYASGRRPRFALKSKRFSN